MSKRKMKHALVALVLVVALATAVATIIMATLQIVGAASIGWGWIVATPFIGFAACIILGAIGSSLEPKPKGKNITDHSSTTHILGGVPLDRINQNLDDVLGKDK